MSSPGLPQPAPRRRLALMQNLSVPDQEALATSIAKLASQVIPPTEKLGILILALMNAVGPEVVEKAANDLRPSIE